MHVYCYNSTLSSVLTQVSQPVSKLLFSLLLPVAETAEKNKAATQAKRRIYFPGGTSAASQWVQGKKLNACCYVALWTVQSVREGICLYLYMVNKHGYLLVVLEEPPHQDR